MTTREAIQNVIAFIEANQAAPGADRARDAAAVIADRWARVVAITEES